MNEFPRLALATPAEDAEPSVACLAMLAGLTERRWRVQHFRTRACPTAMEAVGQVTGLPGRHLDAWLMPPEVCRCLFARGASSAELSIVEGTLGEPKPTSLYTSCDSPGDLRPIAQALDLPVVAVVSCRAGASESLHLPRLPDGIDAVLIDELTDPAALPQLKRLFGLGANLPVIGAIEMMPEARAALLKSPSGSAVAGGAGLGFRGGVPKTRQSGGDRSTGSQPTVLRGTGAGSTGSRSTATRVSRGLRSR